MSKFTQSNLQPKPQGRVEHHDQSESFSSEQRRRARIAASAQFNGNKVISRMPSVPSDISMMSVLRQFMFGRKHLKPQVELPYQQVDCQKLASISDELRVTWLGHSSLFVELDGKRILIDPVFDYAAPRLAKRWFKRNVPAPIQRSQLPLPDVIVISHDHYDHLEESTIRYFAQHKVRFLVPLAVGRHLEKWGVAEQNIQELDWWESYTLGGIHFTATPANHNSGRSGFDSNQTLWCSWAIRGQNGALFYSGDSAYDSHFSQIGAQLGPFDIAFIEVAANVKSQAGYPVENWGHMQAKHTLQAFNDLNAQALFPVHWSTFELFTHKWDEPIEDLIAGAKQAEVALVVPMIGETIEPRLSPVFRTWWRQLGNAKSPVNTSRGQTSRNQASITRPDSPAEQSI